MNVRLGCYELYCDKRLREKGRWQNKVCLEFYPYCIYDKYQRDAIGLRIYYDDYRKLILPYLLMFYEDFNEYGENQIETNVWNQLIEFIEEIIKVLIVDAEKEFYNTLINWLKDILKVTDKIFVIGNL